MTDYAARGVAAAIDHRNALDATRMRAAALVGAASAQSIGFVQSTTAGIVTLARSIPWRTGDRIVCFEGEFPANVTPWQMLARDAKLELVWLPLEPFQRSIEEGLDSVAASLEGVRLVAVSAVQFQTGFRMPLQALGELCRQVGAELFVDAIQCLGVSPVDVQAQGIDYLVSGGHKFLMGLEGAGIAYVSPNAMAKLSLSHAGWTGHEDGFRFLMGSTGQLHYDRPIARRASFLEQGALSMTALAALDASLALLESLGIANIFAHVTNYLDALETELVALGCTSVRAMDPRARSATLSVRLPHGKDLGHVAKTMQQLGVSASTPDGFLRFAPHWPNNAEREVPLVADVFARALAE
jgi:selenocysteine lyase/cysteine desulfurase